ncbi:MAG: VCBS repeat-containing protein [Cyclobacteriaceae bacterium]|nr:VCBS repeat-containing protein [Cyclobacteriaceae bacterium]
MGSKASCLNILVIALGLLAKSCTNVTNENKDKLFSLLTSDQTAINFSNTLLENDDFNIIEYLYFFNGGGVSIGDINNDGLPDVYFTSNQGKNALYLNEGNFKFRNIARQAGVEGEGNWTTGVTMADVNADGWLDIYVCGVGNYKKFNGYNQLFINNGDLTFTESSVELGIYFKGFSTQAAFFDYDLDGDLDMYLLNHSVHSARSYGQAKLRYQEDSLAGDKLFKNQLIETGITKFIDVTQSSGILSSQIGYGLGIGISDLNRDGFPDIYVSNDFHENDYLYINQRDGSFKETSILSLAHTSRFSMGNEIADVNNDLWPDIITTDMLPRDEAVIKTSAGEDSYEVYKFKLSFGYGKQVSRNTFQLNRGTIDSGRLVFSDIAQVAGIEATDWSWCPLVADFDGDGFKDLFISNGIVRRPNDLDYINFINNDSSQNSQLDANHLLSLMPPGKVSNFIFKNNRNLTFIDETFEWGLELPGFSTGAAYSDLDNDGDLDLVVNQINEEALVYRNNSNVNKFVKVKLLANSLEANKFGIGTKVIVKANDIEQVQELYPTRGWYSSSDYSLSFGLGANVDSVLIKVVWPGGFQQDTVVRPGTVSIQYNPDKIYSAIHNQGVILQPFSILPILHYEDDFNAFNRESLIPHMLTKEGPCLAVGDINGDGLDDFFVGGAKGQAGSIYVQEKNETFRLLTSSDFTLHKDSEDVDAAFFDADGDHDLDLIIVAGGHEAKDERDRIAPRLYLNNGKGYFQYSPHAFTNIFINASCVKPQDYDLDGDIDLFIGASVMPFLYGMSPVSYLMVNNGKGIYEPAINWLGTSVFNNPTRIRPGMVKDAIWKDINLDELPDLILVGEWMPITILIQNPDHSFLNITNEFGFEKTNGFWNVIQSSDFNKDGKPDFVIGNLGLNSRVRASLVKPLLMYVGDFDSNGGSDHILVYYNNDRNYPFASRDQLIKQIPMLKKKFPNYKSYRDVKLEDIISPNQKGNSARMSIEELRSVLLLSDGDSYKVNPLPMEAQYFPVFAIEISDLNHDGYEDLLLSGNFSATQPDFGSYDAGVGLMLIGDGQGNFNSIPPLKSGFVTMGEGRQIKSLKTMNGKLYLVARNNDSILAFKNN